MFQTVSFPCDQISVACSFQCPLHIRLGGISADIADPEFFFRVGIDQIQAFIDKFSGQECRQLILQIVLQPLFSDIAVGPFPQVYIILQKFRMMDPVDRRSRLPVKEGVLLYVTYLLSAAIQLQGKGGIFAQT